MEHRCRWFVTACQRSARLEGTHPCHRSQGGHFAAQDNLDRFTARCAGTLSSQRPYIDVSLVRVQRTHPQLDPRLHRFGGRLVRRSATRRDGDPPQPRRECSSSGGHLVITRCHPWRGRAHRRHRSRVLDHTHHRQGTQLPGFQRHRRTAREPHAASAWVRTAGHWHHPAHSSSAAHVERSREHHRHLQTRTRTFVAHSMVAKILYRHSVADSRGLWFMATDATKQTSFKRIGDDS